MRLPTGPGVLETEIGSQLNDSGRRLVQPDGEQLTGERVGGSFQAGTASEALLVAARPLVPARREAELDPADFQLRCVRYYRDAGPRLDYLVPVAAGLGNLPLGQATELTVQPGSDGHKPVARVSAPPDREKHLWIIEMASRSPRRAIGRGDHGPRRAVPAHPVTGRAPLRHWPH